MAYGKPDKWPDGTPRNAQPLGSEVPMRDGHALRRADGWESPPSLGWLTGPAAVTDPQGTGYTKFGPGTAIWNSRKAAKTLGDQKGSRKPR